MTKKETFLCVCDYGMGGVWMNLKASSAHEIEERFPDFKVVPGRPAWMTDHHYERIAEKLSFDIDSPTGWLASFIYSKQRESEGKRPYLFRGEKFGVTEFRTIWAHNESEITARYTGLEVMVNVGVPVDDLSNVGVSDIDEVDEFLERYRK